MATQFEKLATPTGLHKSKEINRLALSNHIIPVVEIQEEFPTLSNLKSRGSDDVIGNPSPFDWKLLASEFDDLSLADQKKFAIQKAEKSLIDKISILKFFDWAETVIWKDCESLSNSAIEDLYCKAIIKVSRAGYSTSGNLVKAKGSATATQSPHQLKVTMASDIEPEKINWLWRNHIAKGKGMILTGLPDMGKSNISISIAASISTGGKWPDGTTAPRGKVLILSSEDAPSDTIVPRIIAAGGDRTMIGFLQQRIGEKGKSRMITLKEDLEAMGAAVKSMGNVSLVIIDPVTGYMGNGVDTHKAADVRAVLDGVSLWAINTT